MRKHLRAKGGFTLIELMVVVIIVGILAAVAIPLYRANVRKGMASEGAALLGSVLTAQRVYYAEHSTFAADAQQTQLGVDGTGNKYFTSYSIDSGGGTSGGFVASTSYTGQSPTITVTMTYSHVAGTGATIDYSGI